MEVFLFGAVKKPEITHFWVINHLLRLLIIRGHKYPRLSSITPYPLSPHDALKHHFKSLKTDLILLQPRVLERKLP